MYEIQRLPVFFGGGRANDLWVCSTLALRSSSYYNPHHDELPVQMVGLYNDPEGDTIFDRSNKTSTSANNNLQTQTIEGLKKRVIELEAIITSSQEVSFWILVWGTFQ